MRTGKEERDEKDCIRRRDIGRLKPVEGVVGKDKILPATSETHFEKSNITNTSSTKEESEISNEMIAYQDAISALLTLGYKATDADTAIRKASSALSKDASTEELIRKALGS